MSLFKVLRGKKQDLGSQELHDGYAWYTTDEAGFYIDAETSANNVVRKKINDADNVTVSSTHFQSTNLRTVLEGLDDSSGASLSYDSATETLTIQ